MTAEKKANKIVVSSHKCSVNQNKDVEISGRSNDGDNNERS
jgi:hypothetical protein